MNVQLISEIDAFLAESRIGEHRFGILAASNGRLVERLRSGGRVWPETEERVRAFIAKRREAGTARQKRRRMNDWRWERDVDPIKA
jgi:hypothetical protein